MSNTFSNADTGSKPADPYTDKNLQEPSVQEKVNDLAAFVDKCKFCMMTIKMSDGELASRCMALAAREDNGVDFLFHTNTESGKTDDLTNSPAINLGFLTSSGEWASISGHATIETDRERIRQYYSPSLKAWLGDLGDGKHDGGPEDPRIGLIKLESKTAQYAVSGKNVIAQAIEVAKGMVTGEAAAVNKLRHLSEEELKRVRAGQA